MYPLLTAGLMWAGAVPADQAFNDCIPRLQQRATAAGVSAATVQGVLGKTQYVAKVIELDQRQPEFSETFYNYITTRVTEARVRQGRLMLARHQALLDKLQQQYGVPPQYLLAFWGLETNFGSYMGSMQVLDSLATLACDPRRSEFFTLELIDALKLVDADTVKPVQFTGSWAGAVGNMQFMPSTYRAHAVDGDGDGRADLWRSIPDALASAANYLSHMGWKRDMRWGREVLLPAGFDYGQTSLAERQPLHHWHKQGVTLVSGEPVPDVPLRASILVPAGHTGPAFMVYENFDIIMRWNRSESYAIAVGHLADRIKGGALLVRMPPNMARLSKSKIEALQIALNGAGFDTGHADGVLGSGTRKALRAWQKSKGMIADGFPSPEVFMALGIAFP